MTCIVGMIEGNRVVMGADSAGSNSYDIRIINSPKVFRNGEFIIGGTGSWRMLQLLNFSLDIPEVGDMDIYEFICTKFIKQVRKTFRKGGYIQKHAEGNDKGGLFLVAYKDRLFKVESDFTVVEQEQKFDSCGSGEDYANAIMCYFKDSGMSVNVILTKALEVATKLSAGVEPPYTFLST